MIKVASTTGTAWLRLLVMGLALAAAALSGSALAGPAGVLDQIKQRGEIRLAYRDDAPPFSFADANGVPSGYSVDLCLAAAQSIKAQLKMSDLKISYVKVTADDRFDAIAQGKADLLCEATSETLSRRELVDFSIPTFLSGASLMIQPGGPDTFPALAGKKVGVLSGTTTERGLRNFLRDSGINAEVVVVQSHPEGFKKLEQGEIAAYFGDRTIMQYHLVKSDPTSKLMLADQYLTIEPYALALPHDPAFRLAVDRGLSRLYRNGGISKVFARSFGDQATPSKLLSALYTSAALPE